MGLTQAGHPPVDMNDGVMTLEKNIGNLTER